MCGCCLPWSGRSGRRSPRTIRSRSPHRRPRPFIGSSSVPRREPVTALPLVSVIVPVFNDADRLSACLDALAEQDYPVELVQVIVVDNGSTDDVGDVLSQRAGVCVLHEPRQGSYSARNAGIAAATGAVLAFTDSDCLPTSRWLSEAVRTLQLLPRPARVGGRL